MTSWSIFINGCMRRRFSSLLFFVDNHMYRHIRNGRWAISLSHISIHSSMNVCSFSSSISHFFFSNQYSLSLYHQHTQRKERYEGNYWRIIECWHIFLISCLPILLLGSFRFMQHCCIHTTMQIYWCDMNNQAYERFHSISTNTRHNVAVI